MSALLVLLVVNSLPFRHFRDVFICGVSRYRRPSLSRLRSTTTSVINSLSSTKPPTRVQTLSSSGLVVRVRPYDLLIVLDDAHDRVHCDGSPDRPCCGPCRSSCNYWPHMYYST